MTHNHENCKVYLCYGGYLMGYCDYEECDNPDCVVIGHCECLCHSGKTCGCGLTWPRMEKQSKDKDD